MFRGCPQVGEYKCWNGMDYWNGLQGSNSQLLFLCNLTLSNGVSMASRYCYDNVRKNCTRINGETLCENWSWCGQALPYTRLLQKWPFSAASHRPFHSIFRDYAGILYYHTAPFSPNCCVLSPVCTYAFSLVGVGGGGGGAL